MKYSLPDYTHEVVVTSLPRGRHPASIYGGRSPVKTQEMTQPPVILVKDLRKHPANKWHFKLTVDDVDYLVPIPKSDVINALRGAPPTGRVYASLIITPSSAVLGRGNHGQMLIDKMFQLRSMAQRLHDADQEHFEGGCGDVCAVLFKAAQAVGLPGVELHAGIAKRLRRTDQVWHAWLTVDGRVFDPTWLITFGKPGLLYEENPALLHSLLSWDLDDPEEWAWWIDVALDRER